MTTITPAAARGTLVDRVLPRSLVTDAALVVSGTALVSVLAQVEVPMFPVPITGQTLGVLLVGAALGARRGATSLALYLALGLAGLPIFAGFTGGIDSVLKPSFGFIVGFVVAAGFVGWLAQRAWDRHLGRNLLAALGGTAIPFAFGLPYMTFTLPMYGLPNDLGSVFAFGVTPFIVGGLIKAAIAGVTLPVAWKIVERIDRSR
jgi:biotin transport system substrate-specific component